MEFQFNLPVNLLFGCNKTNEIGKITAQYGKKVLIVTGKGSTKKSGLLKRVEELLTKENLTYDIFDKVEQNPLTTTVYEGANLAKEKNSDVILGIGGGSIMDAAKAIAIASVDDTDLSEYIFAKKVLTDALPIVLLPTTCGTGSEGNGFAVLTDPETNDKKSIRSNVIIAKTSVIDPLLMKTMPKSVLASVGFDALAHNMEAYLSKSCQPIIELLAQKGIELIGTYLPLLYEDIDNLEALEQVTLASTYGGMVISHAGVSAPHGMEHPASGLKNIVHGRGLAALTPVIFERSILSNPKKFATISTLLGGKDETDCVETIRTFLKKIDLAVTLGEQGIKEEDIEWMATNCLKVSEAAIKANPKEFTVDELKEIYQAAL